MTTTAARRSSADKHEDRRRALAEAALVTLGELGYARSSLREIANNSEFSHGVVHYYFRDKLELIIHCVRHYKATCVTRYDGVVATSTTPAELLDGFSAKLRQTITEDAAMHRLWYDFRTQAMFEPELRAAALAIDKTLEQMVWRVITRYAELSGAEPGIDPRSAYGILDGLFQQALFGNLCGRTEVLDELDAQVHGLMPMMLAR
ncbi:TetR/AcrR family transcriptional regulator [Marmoricola sp. RAF53]|uniref:TetR/AcrR family transcriptional regulator n=1 Tax=Marmoricola sp. RAF53 TaxID=3233059 RepID=UPI003F99B8F8